jgi:hypothetical protein
MGMSHHAAVDPSDPGHLFVVYSVGTGGAGVVAISRDGGNTWSLALVA